MLFKSIPKRNDVIINTLKRFVLSAIQQFYRIEILNFVYLILHYGLLIAKK